MLNAERKPSEQEIISIIGNAELWDDLKHYLEQRYNSLQERIFCGEKYGWTVLYLKGSMTLCSLFPERGAFTVLVVLGMKEEEKVLQVLDELSIDTRKLIRDSKRLYNCKWIWIRMLKPVYVEDVKVLLAIKCKPVGK